MANGNGKQTALQIRQEGFGQMSTQGVGETAAMAIAAQAKAAIEARWIVAMKCPRDVDQVRAEILRECKRPAFAEVARYLKPIGEGVTGPSIRFVEQALLAFGNCDTEAITIYDDQEKRIIEVRVIDFERNVTHRKQITVTKQVERKYLRKGQTAIGTRTNSSGDQIYIVQASDDDILNKESALISKALRTCGLRLIPGWLVEEAMSQVVKTQQDQAARDPDSERRKVADAFAEINVQPGDLSRYLGHDLGQVSPGELTELRQVYATIRDGHANWPDILANRLERRGEQAAEAAPDPAPAPKRGAQAAKAAMRKPAAKPKPAAQAPAPPAQEAAKPKAKPPAPPKPAPAPRQAAPPPPPAPEPEPEPEPAPEPEAPQEEFEIDAANAIDVEHTEDGEAYDAGTGEVLEEGDVELTTEGEDVPEDPEPEEDEFQEPDWMKSPAPPPPKAPKRGNKPPQGEGF